MGQSVFVRGFPEPTGDGACRRATRPSLFGLTFAPPEPPLLALPAPSPHLVAMPDPTERLNAALEGHYRVERVEVEQPWMRRSD